MQPHSELHIELPFGADRCRFDCNKKSGQKRMSLTLVGFLHSRICIFGQNSITIVESPKSSVYLSNWQFKMLIIAVVSSLGWSLLS